LFQRLKSDKAIETIFKEGKSLFAYPIKLVYCKLPTDGATFNFYAGVSVSKRNFKRAVDRNRIKRQMRESIRLNLMKNPVEMNENYAIMVIYVSKEKLDYRIIDKTMAKLLKKVNI
jgi:ribonuclease P protein component